MPKTASTPDTDLERFLYRVSHDLKSPALIIQGFAKELQESLEGGNIPDALENLSFINKSTTRLLEMLDGLLRLSRLGNKPLPSTPIDLAPILQGIAKNSDVVLHLPTEAILVAGDAMQITELLKCLLDNSRKFSRPQLPLQVNISVARHKEMWELRLTDNGIGIDPKHLNNLFEVFVKLNPKSEGLGLGLPCALRIAERHGGTIVLESAGKNLGCSAIVTLPPCNTGAPT